MYYSDMSDCSPTLTWSDWFIVLVINVSSFCTPALKTYSCLAIHHHLHHCRLECVDCTGEEGTAGAGVSYPRLLFLA